MLWLGLLARDTGIPASQHLKIEDEVVALDFNRAVTLRLLRYDNEKDRANRRFWVSLVAGSDAAEELQDEVLSSEFLANDKYADANTEQW